MNYKLPELSPWETPLSEYEKVRTSPLEEQLINGIIGGMAGAAVSSSVFLSSIYFPNRPDSLIESITGIFGLAPDLALLSAVVVALYTTTGTIVGVDLADSFNND